MTGRISFMTGRLKPHQIIGLLAKGEKYGRVRAGKRRCGRLAFPGGLR